MSKTTSTYIVSARNFRVGGVVYFDGAGHWTTELCQAQIARSPVGRKALLRVATALTNDTSIIGPDLTEIRVPSNCFSLSVDTNCPASRTAV